MLDFEVKLREDCLIIIWLPSRIRKEQHLVGTLAGGSIETEVTRRQMTEVIQN